MQAAANGFLYVLDRGTGALISATPYVPVNWATGVDLSNGRPIESPEARYSERGKPFVSAPGQRGAHSWQSMAYNSETGLLYIPAMINSSELGVDVHSKPSRYASNSGATAQPAPNALPDFSRLIAWNPATGVAAWHIDSPTPTASGVLVTGGALVFKGNTDGLMQALDAKSGKTLWQFDTRGRLEAAPITYEVQGRQYIALVAGTHGTHAGEAPRLLVFALGSNKKLPTVEPLPRPTPPTSFGSPLQISQGTKLYQRYCTRCHGSTSEDRAAFLRLSASPQLANKEQWRLTVFAGQHEQKGMPGFFAEISEADAESIRGYVVEQAHRPTVCTRTGPISPDGRSAACGP
jgi:quinohemoprotein ethanol dehydrogenase